MEKFVQVPVLLMLLRHYDTMIKSAEAGVAAGKKFEVPFLGNESFSTRAGLVLRSVNTMRQYVADLLHKETVDLHADCAEIVQHASGSVDLPPCTVLFRSTVSLSIKDSHFMFDVVLTVHHSCRTTCAAHIPFQEYLPVYMEQCREMIAGQLQAVKIPAALGELTVITA